MRIAIPSPKKPFTILFLIVWLLIWVPVGGVFASAAIGGAQRGALPILFVGLWALFAFGGIYHLLWQLVGKEKIHVTSDTISIRLAVLGLGSSKALASKHISHMRIDPIGRVEPYSLGPEGVSFNRGTGMIAFDYRGKTIRMGIGLDEAEARDLVAEIVGHFPQYGR